VFAFDDFRLPILIGRKACERGAMARFQASRRVAIGLERESGGAKVELRKIVQEAMSMAQFGTENIRTLALVGHGASGKTTLAEALLLKSGSVQVAGSVERGSAISDFDPLERSWQHSLRASVLHLEARARACT
jgi:ABC-type glutathione transport system ATPase component